MGIRNALLERLTSLITSLGSNGRLRVDVSQTGFWEGREFRLDVKVTAPIVIKFESPVNFILQAQTLASNNGDATFEAWAASQGAAGGTFATTTNILPNNAMSTTPEYTRQITAFSGGTFTPTGGQVARELISIKAGTQTSQRSTVGGSSIKERGLPAGIYYLKFTGTDAYYNLVFEERP